MVVSVAFTSPIPSSLTKDQVWKGLVLKSRDARGFLDAIETCTVISERPNGVTRLGKFKNTDPVHEVITYFPPYTVSNTLIAS